MTSRLAGLTGERRRDRTIGLPRLRLVAVAQGRARKAQVGRARRDGVGRLGDGVPRRRRPRAPADAVRPGAALSPGRGSSGGARIRRRRARHLRVPPFFGLAGPGSSNLCFWRRSGRLGTRARAPSRRSPTDTGKGRPRRRSASSYTERSSRATSWPTSASGPFARSGASADEARARQATGGRGRHARQGAAGRSRCASAAPAPAPPG